MSYMLLIVEPIGQRRTVSEYQGRARYQRMLNFAEALKDRGVLQAAQSLKSEVEGLRVQRQDGRVVHIDGPYSETKEMIGGFFLLDCDDRAQAITIAEECPAAEWATVEVRELGPCFM